MWVRAMLASIIGGCLFILSASAPAALKAGYTVKSIKVRDSNDKPAWIPDIGKKVITLFYTDPDVKDQNEPFREMLKAAKLGKSNYRAMGVVNMKDTWKPNFAIRSVVRSKIEKFKSLILTDPGHALKNQWHLGDCDDKDVVIVIGTDKKVKYLKMGKMSQAEMKSTLNLVKNLLSQVK